ncbi:hypothetical protein [Nitrosospira sp. Nsp1]|uniref:hypothetical protein n=1 Tax=Nitrosospira sp. Nsp1 TaxID=136547 RepID=UPI0008834028|nr:hypothetical protein [Nitrosospira sp. Nsp1]SCX37849.1 hypothetical protein SAMN05720354_101195 [Nitrosospira sp. Nsp1]
MKHTFILKNSATRFLIIAGTLILGTVAISHAQTAPTDMAAQGGAYLLAQAGSSAEQPASGWQDPVTGQATATGNNTPAPAQAAPAQAASSQTDSPSGWSSTGQQTSDSCQHATPEQESFLCKVVRILYRAESPRGPNRDMDENISVGGAGG